ncbi:MAG TPA: hypothetical protein VIL07_10295 [Symbiobacteriaceae bacterium]
MLPYLQTCLQRQLYPLCLLPGNFARLGLVLGLRDTVYGPVAVVLCLATGEVEEHDPFLLDPCDPR